MWLQTRVSIWACRHFASLAVVLAMVLFSGLRWCTSIWSALTGGSRDGKKREREREKFYVWVLRTERGITAVRPESARPLHCLIALSTVAEWESERELLCQLWPKANAIVVACDNHQPTLGRCTSKTGPPRSTLGLTIISSLQLTQLSSLFFFFFDKLSSSSSSS